VRIAGRDDAHWEQGHPPSLNTDGGGSDSDNMGKGKPVTTEQIRPAYAERGEELEEAEAALLALIKEEPGIHLTKIFDAAQEAGLTLPEPVVAQALIRLINGGQVILTDHRELKPA
jgi:hypothetical protein